MWRGNSLKKTTVLGKIEGRRRRGQQSMRWMASPTQWVWIWTTSRREWRTKKPGGLRSLRWQGVEHDLGTEQQQQQWHMSNVNYIDSWSCRISCSVRESKVVTDTIFVEFGNRKYDIEVWFSDIQTLGFLCFFFFKLWKRWSLPLGREGFHNSCAEKFNWALSTCVYYTSIMAFEKEWTPASQGKEKSDSYMIFPLSDGLLLLTPCKIRQTQFSAQCNVILEVEFVQTQFYPPSLDAGVSGLTPFWGKGDN